MQRRRLWTAAGVLTTLSVLSFWLARSVLAGMHEATGKDLFRLDAVLMEQVRAATPAGWAPLLLF